MSCYHPLIGISQGVSVETGKTKYRIVSYSDKLINDPYVQFMGYVTIPCGKCIGCRLEYSRQWANRCMLEQQYHDQSWFVTLTYNDWNLPMRKYVDEKSGQEFDSMSLCKRDFQLFMKRLRKEFGDQKIRFFAAGEYGGNTYRPHYHAILFGLHLDDLRVYKVSSDGFNYYNSPRLQKVWDSGSKERPFWIPCKEGDTPLTGRGFCVVAPVNWNTCAYVARYVTKKLNGPATEFYSRMNIEPPFSLMSRKPGIGRQYYDDHPDMYKYEFINVPTKEGGKKFKPPKYFDRLYEIDQPEHMEVIKEARKHFADEAKKAKLDRTELSYLDMLQVEENYQTDKAKKLERRLQ